MLFFKQAVLHGEIGHDLLQWWWLPTKILYLAGSRSTRCVTRQPALADLEELLRSAVMH
jgi:hypothetical protein